MAPYRLVAGVCGWPATRIPSWQRRRRLPHVYAGRFTVRDDTVFHTIEVATNPALIGITSTRKIELADDTLALSGPDFGADSPRTQRIVWQRANAAV